MMRIFTAVFFCVCMASCSVQKQIAKTVGKFLFNDSAISSGHIGISIYDPSNNAYLYNYNADKYFIPASNTKLFTLYAGMKYLGDSLVGLRYKMGTFADEGSPNVIHKNLIIEPTGDPTFLHPDFPIQNVFDFLKTNDASIRFNQGVELDKPYGKGWAWDDLNEDYAVGRSAFPIYGNVIRLNGKLKTLHIEPPYLIKSKSISIDSNAKENNFYRDQHENKFYSSYNNLIRFSKSIPIIPKHFFTLDMLADTLGKNIIPNFSYRSTGTFISTKFYKKSEYTKDIIHSQPSDSLFKPMIYRSDNFFAEQTLLMASNEHIGFMDDEKMIDTLLSTDLKDVPQRPKWVDGSGLSRYNLFTPKDFVYILNKMKNEFGLKRLKAILPTGGKGTLSNYFTKDAGFIYAKTGTLSNNSSLSGFIITRKNKLLFFSVMNNNFITGATPVRRAVETFLINIRNKY